MATQHEWVVKRGNGADYVWRTATGWSTARADALRMSFEDARTLKLRLGELDIWSKLTVAYESAAQAPEETPPDWVVMRMLDGVKTWKRVWTGDQTRWTPHPSEAAHSSKETAEHEAAREAYYNPDGSVVAVPLTAEMLAAAKAQAESTAVPKDPEWVVKRTLDGGISWGHHDGDLGLVWTNSLVGATRMSELLAKGLATRAATMVAMPWEEALAETGGAAPTAIKSAGDLTAPLPTVLTEDMLVEACAAAVWEATEARARGRLAAHRPRSWREAAALTQDFTRKLVRGILGVATAAGPEHDETVRNAVFSVAKALGWTPPAQADGARRGAWSTYDGVVRGLQEIREQDTATPAAEPADWIVQGEWRGGPIYWHGYDSGWLTIPAGAERLTRSTAEHLAKKASEEGRPAKAVPWEAPVEEKAEWLIRETERGYYLHGKFMPGFHGWNSDRQMAAKFTHTEAARIASLIVNPTEVVRQDPVSATDEPKDWLIHDPDRKAYFARTSDTPGFVWVANPWMATSFTEAEAEHAAASIGGALTITHKNVALDGWPRATLTVQGRPPPPADWAVKSSSGKPYLVVLGSFSIQWSDAARATKLTRAEADDWAVRLNAERTGRGLTSYVHVVPWPNKAEG